MIKGGCCKGRRATSKGRAYKVVTGGRCAVSVSKLLIITKLRSDLM